MAANIPFRMKMIPLVVSMVCQMIGNEYRRKHG